MTLLALLPRHSVTGTFMPPRACRGASGQHGRPGIFAPALLPWHSVTGTFIPHQPAAERQANMVALESLLRQCWPGTVAPALRDGDLYAPHPAAERQADIDCAFAEHQKNVQRPFDFLLAESGIRRILTR
jgi:hypothetical protein